jgi:hypothetical protein
VTSAGVPPVFGLNTVLTVPLGHILCFVPSEVLAPIVMKCCIFYLLHAGSLLGFDSEDGGCMFFRNIGWLPADYMTLHLRRQNPSSSVSSLKDPKVLLSGEVGPDIQDERNSFQIRFASSEHFRFLIFSIFHETLNSGS